MVLLLVVVVVVIVIIKTSDYILSPFREEKETLKSTQKRIKSKQNIYKFNFIFGLKHRK